MVYFAKYNLDFYMQIMLLLGKEAGVLTAINK